MKRIIATTFVIALLFSACGGGGTTTSTPPEDAGLTLEAPVSLRMATGGPSGTYYAYGGVIATVLQEKIGGLELSVVSTEASRANINMVADGEADIAMVQNDVMDYAARGVNLFETDGMVEGFSAMAALYNETCQIVARPGINTVADLAGKNVSLGDAGSGVYFNAVQILDAYGLTEADLNVQFLSFGDSANAYKDGKIDAFFVTAGPPTTAITELATTNEFVMLEIDDEHADALIAKNPYYTKDIITGGTYSGIDNDVKTVAVEAVFIVSNNLSEDVVYNLTKGLFEYKDEIAAAHAKGAYLDTGYAVGGISIPLHPGAAKYFEEIG